MMGQQKKKNDPQASGGTANEAMKLKGILIIPKIKAGYVKACLQKNMSGFLGHIFRNWTASIYI